MALQIERLAKKFGRTKALDGVDLHVREGEFLVILGPSGCGKTTLLRCIAGLEWPDSGRVILWGRDVTNDSPSSRDVAFVFQQPTLLPNKTVAENIAYPLVCRQNSIWRLIRGGLTDQQQAIAQHWAERLNIVKLLNRYPHTLSGGEMQRVCLGRAFAKNASLILFDEPLANLDLRLRDALRLQLLRLKEEEQAARRSTMVYVTHEQEDALVLADRLAVMKDGRIVQVGTWQEVYKRPVDVFTASFVGSPEISLVAAVITVDRDMYLGLWGAQMPLSGDVARSLGEVKSGTRVILGIRPEHLRLDEHGCFEGRVLRVKDLVHYSLVWLQIVDDQVCAVCRSTSGLWAGKVVQFSVETDSCLLFSADSGRRLPEGEPVRRRGPE